MKSFLRVDINEGLREKTTAVLREAIINFHFRPGEKLVERKLCEATGVSRTCVREALRVLEVEGLVDRAPNAGIRVHDVGVEEAEQIYEARATLEAAMVARFIDKADVKHHAKLDRAVAGVELMLNGDLGAYVKALDKVSETLMEGAGNAVVKQMIGVLNARITYLRMLTSRLGTLQQREQSFLLLKECHNAIVATKRDEAVSLMNKYVRFSADNARTILLRLGSEHAKLRDSLNKS